MTVSTAVLIEEDVQILLDRALLSKSICAFGEDGLGKHGRHDRASWFKIKSVDITIECDEDDDYPEEIQGIASLKLEGYDSTVVGHIMTDHNFKICLDAFLKNTDIDPDSLTWPDDLEMQGDDFVTLNIDIGLLLGW